MALAHHPDPEEVECLLRNAELRDAIEPYLDEAVFEIDFRLLPTPVENRFLESMLAWEQAPLVPIARWFEPPLAMQPACTLDDEQVHGRLWQVIERLFEKRVVLEYTDHLSDRELYCLVYRDILPSREKKVDLGTNYLHWDCAFADGDPEIWLRYYASDEDRQAWAETYRQPLPPRAVPAHPRHLPRAPM